MRRKFFGAILFLALFIVATGASAQPAAYPTQQYNKFLKGLHVSNIIQADTLVYQENLTHADKNREVRLMHVYVLKLKPNASYSSPFQFAPAWNSAVSSFGGNALYQLLFTKLAGDTGMPPESIAIKFSFTELYSFLIYYDKGVKISKTIINGRDGGVTDPGDLDDSSVGGMFLNTPVSGNAEDKLYARLLPALKTYKHHKEITVLRGDGSNVATPGMLAIKVGNLSRHVTGNPHENICINLFFTPGKETGRLNIYYLFNVYYASGLAEPAAKDYHNAIPEYTDEVRSYGLNLKKLIRAAVDKK